MITSTERRLEVGHIFWRLTSDSEYGTEKETNKEGMTPVDA